MALYTRVSMNRGSYFGNLVEGIPMFWVNLKYPRFLEIPISALSHTREVMKTPASTDAMLPQIILLYYFYIQKTEHREEEITLHNLTLARSPDTSARGPSGDEEHECRCRTWQDGGSEL